MLCPFSAFYPLTKTRVTLVYIYMRRFSVFFVLLLLPLSLYAKTATKLEVAGWLPYWKKESAASSTLANLSNLNEISPFSYTVKSDASIFNPMDTGNEPWTSLFTEARKKGVKIYPSILWTDRAQMETVLNNKKKRTAHIARIVKEVKDNKWDGIDIDYEGKSAETRVGYSSFLKELKASLKPLKKDLVCTIEARTPVDSRYSKVTKELLARIEYSNDFKAIGTHCDKVRIMAYDQSNDDLQLVTKYTGSAYKPIADIDWVKKVITLAMEDIPTKKLYLGVATYGYKYEIVKNVASSTTSYPRIGAMNFNYADELAKSLNITPTRNMAGELSFTYATTTIENGQTKQKEYLVWYSDAVAVADKARIAKLYGIKGVSIFKLDGGYDPKLWEELKKKL